MRARSLYCRRLLQTSQQKKSICECHELTYVCHTYACPYVLLCGPKIRNKDSCNYLTTNSWKERDMGGVGQMIGTSASKRGWSGRGHMRARGGAGCGGKEVANERCSLSKLAVFFKIPPLFKRSGGRFQCVEQRIPIRWH